MLIDDDPFGSAPVIEAPPRRRSEGETVVIPAQLGKPITVTLPYPPSANRYWRTRVVFPKMEKMAAVYKDGGVKALLELLQKESFVNTYPSSEAKAFKEAVAWLLKSAGVRSVIAARRFRVDIVLWPHRPQDWKTRMRKDPLYWADTVQRLDLDNTRKAVNDALNEVAIPDDKAIWEDSGTVMEPDGRDACLVVTITPLVKASPQGALL
jgi:crossover junction endodeoxyribonuclease RusA